MRPWTDFDARFHGFYFYDFFLIRRQDEKTKRLMELEQSLLSLLLEFS